MDKKLGGDPSILLFLFLFILTYSFSRCPDQILFALEIRVSLVFLLSPLELPGDTGGNHPQHGTDMNLDRQSRRSVVYQLRQFCSCFALQASTYATHTPDWLP